MSFFGRAKKILKPASRIQRWIGYTHLKESTRTLFTLGKAQFIPRQARYSESFEEAITRLGLTESDLSQRQKIFTRLMRIWLLMFSVTFIYSVHLAIGQAWRSVAPTLILSTVTLIQAFRYHFWLFQIQHRKLGCRFHEWFTTYFKKSSRS